MNKTIDQIAFDWYGKKYEELPDDGVEQDNVMIIFSSSIMGVE